ncbi:PAS domain-containing protein [Nocardioides aurantiacus]|uniref:PAS domain-containing protein n=1 Tax=Nocardioides aurantiacus TaxID=86796 RepID=UPI00403FA53C
MPVSDLFPRPGPTSAPGHGWAESTPGFGRWLHDFTDGTWSWSEEMIAMYDAGLSNPGDVEAVFARLHPDDRDRVRTSLEDAMRSGSPLNGQYRFRTDTRGERVFAFFGDPVRIGRDMVVSLRGYTIDVTDHVHAVARGMAAEMVEQLLRERTPDR